MRIKTMMKCGLMLLLCNSCGYNIITKALDNKDQLPSSEQIKALREQNMDVYICFTLGGPPPIGNITIIAIPKGSKPNFAYSSNCGLLQGNLNQPVYPTQYPTYPYPTYPSTNPFPSTGQLGTDQLMPENRTTVP